MRRPPSVASAHLDQALPAYSFREVHRIRLTGPVPNVPNLVKSLEWREAPGFHRVINAAGLGIHRFDPHEKILSMFLNGPYRILSESRHEIVFGALLSNQPTPTAQHDDSEAPLDVFRQANPTGTVKVATNFIERDGFLWTETRVLPVGKAAAILFTPYWYGIRIGGGFIRRSWLKGLRARADSSR